jgi:hypothetical protein
VVKEFRESATVSVSAEGRPFELMAPDPANTDPDAAQQ